MSTPLFGPDTRSLKKRLRDGQPLPFGLSTVPRSVTIVRGPAHRNASPDQSTNCHVPGGKAYVKISQRGVAGLANVVPATNCAVSRLDEAGATAGPVLGEIARRRSIDLVKRNRLPWRNALEVPIRRVRRARVHRRRTPG